MQAFEFQATARDGVIPIPDEYVDGMPPIFRVIVMPVENEKEFPYFAIDTTNYIFDREEANER